MFRCVAYGYDDASAMASSLPKPQLERLAGRQGRPLRKQLAPLVPDVLEIVVRDDAGATQAVLPVVRRGGRIELRRRPLLPGGSLPIEEADKQLRGKRLIRKRASRPGAAEVGQVPALGDQAVEAPEMVERGLDGIVGQVVEREEAPLLTFLTLPGHRAVGPPAAQRGGAIGFLLDVDHEVVISRLHT